MVNISRLVILIAMFLVFSLIYSGTAFSADPTKGGAAYTRHCSGCHGSSGQGTFPGMKDFSRGEGLMVADRELLATIKQGKGVMPGFNGLLKDEEILDIIAYLRTLR